jgi:hypothetical protein
MHHYMLEEYYPTSDWNADAEYHVLYEVIVLILNLEKQCGYQFAYDDFDAAIADKSLYWQTKYIGCFNFLCINKMLDSYAPNNNGDYSAYYYKSFRYGLKQVLPEAYHSQLIKTAQLSSYIMQMTLMITIIKFLVIHGSCLYVKCVLLHDAKQQKQRLNA